MRIVTNDLCREVHCLVVGVVALDSATSRSECLVAREFVYEFHDIVEHRLAGTLRASRLKCYDMWMNMYILDVGDLCIGGQY